MPDAGIALVVRQRGWAASLKGLATGDGVPSARASRSETAADTQRHAVTIASDRGVDQLERL